MKNTYKICGKKKLIKKYQLIQAENPQLFLSLEDWNKSMIEQPEPYEGRPSRTVL